MASGPRRACTSAVRRALFAALIVVSSCHDGGSRPALAPSVPPSVPPPEAAAASSVAPTLPPASPEPTGVPGLIGPDPFCSTWATYVGTLQALGTAAAFAELSGQQLAALELTSAPRLAEAAASIGASWPAELESERSVVVDQRIGPFARRADRALAVLGDAGVGAAELITLRSVWQSALLARDPDSPLIAVPPLGEALQAKIDAAAVAFDASVTPFAADPSLAVDGAPTPATDAFLAEHCPDLASSGVGDAL